VDDNQPPRGRLSGLPGLSFSILLARAHCQYRSTVERYWLAADRDQIKTIVAMLIIMATIVFLAGQQTTSDGILQTVSAKSVLSDRPS
jgi:hypothetical protein